MQVLKFKLIWSGWWESNPRFQLGRLEFYHWTTPAKKMVGMTGFEPATPWSQTRCSTKLSHIPKLKLMVQSARLELARLFNHYPLKIACLPVPPRLLSEISCDVVQKILEKMVRVKGLEPPCLAALDPKSSASANSATPAWIKMVGHTGLEPVTPWLKVRCSTAWANDP